MDLSIIPKAPVKEVNYIDISFPLWLLTKTQHRRFGLVVDYGIKAA